MATAFLGYNISPRWLINICLYCNTLNEIFGFQDTYTVYLFLLPIQNKANSLSFSDYNKLLSCFLTEYNLNPVYIFHHLDTNETKNNLMKTLKGLSGVYLIFNRVTGDYYVGSASTNRFSVRCFNHLIHLTGSKLIKNAVKKYGLKNFVFIVLELFPEIINKENNKKLLDLEDFYLKSLLPNYNILTEAGNSYGYKHTEITRIKMKNNYSNDRREIIGNLNRNKKLTEETIEKMRLSGLSRIKADFSPEALLNMKKKSREIIVYNLDKSIFGEYSSVTEAAKLIGCNVKTIHRAFKTKNHILKKRFIVEYK